MRVQPGASDLVASLDGAFVACADNRLALYDTTARALVAEAPLDGEAEIGFVGADRLLALVAGDGRTLLVGYALPSLEPLAQLELEGRLKPLAFVGGRALIATESLEQPRVVAITSKILVESIPLREPIMLATAAPEDRLLVASRTRDAQLECWDPLVRRALFRLNLPLAAQPLQAGFAARRRLLWIASGGAQGLIEVYRFSDGRLQSRVELGAPFAGAAGHPESPRLVVATRARDGSPLQLIELDFQQGERRELSPQTAPPAFCVVEGAAPALVLSDGATLSWMPLSPAMPTDSRAPLAAATMAQPTPVKLSTRAPHPRISDPRDWRARLGTSDAGSAVLASLATAPSPAPPIAEPAAPPGPATDDAEEELHWRDQLCDWSEKLIGAPRRLWPTPPWPSHSTLAVLAARLALDERATRALALLYGARLLGEGDGPPAATVARALTAAAPGDDGAWDEALGRGLLGQLGLARARRGRLRLSAAAARFLDGAPPHVTILGGGANDADLPAGCRRIDGGGEPLATIGARLADRFGYDVALLPIDGDAPRGRLAARLVEARLHGAWPLIDTAADPTGWLDALDDGPTVIVVRGAPPAQVASLPSL